MVAGKGFVMVAGRVVMVAGIPVVLRAHSPISF